MPEMNQPPPSNAVQITKIIVGAVVALGCLAAIVALVLSGKVPPEQLIPLATGVVVGGGVMGHGALKTPTDGQS